MLHCSSQSWIDRRVQYDSTTQYLYIVYMHVQGNAMIAQTKVWVPGPPTVPLLPLTTDSCGGKSLKLLLISDLSKFQRSPMYSYLSYLCVEKAVGCKTFRKVCQRGDISGARPDTSYHHHTTPKPSFALKLHNLENA